MTRWEAVRVGRDYALRTVLLGPKAADADAGWVVVRGGDPGLLLLLLVKVLDESLGRCRQLLPAFRSLRVVVCHPSYNGEVRLLKDPDSSCFPKGATELHD